MILFHFLIEGLPATEPCKHQRDPFMFISLEFAETFLVEGVASCQRK